MTCPALSRFLLITCLFLSAAQARQSVSVDAVEDFDPPNPTAGQIVTWNPGQAGEVRGLMFGSEAFASVQAGIAGVEENGTVFLAAGDYHPSFSPSAPLQRRLQNPPAKSKFLAVSNPMSKNAQKRVLLIGWDSADWKIINDLLAEGGMDGIRTLMDGGIHGNLATLEPQLSPMLWSSIAIGKMAYHHQAPGFTEVDPISGQAVPVSTAMRNWMTCNFAPGFPRIVTSRADNEKHIEGGNTPLRYKGATEGPSRHFLQKKL